MKTNFWSMFREDTGKVSIKRVFGALGMLVGLFMVLATLWKENLSETLIITIFTGSAALLGATLLKNKKITGNGEAE